MNKNKTAIAFCLFFAASPIFAGSVGGTGGSTELTQISNNVQLLNQYAKQVQQYVMQGLQLQAQLRNLIQNPWSLLGPEIGNLINSTGELMSRGKAIGSSVAQIDRNFATMFKSPTAHTLSQNFLNWHQTNTDTLEAALKTVGLHREQGATDARELQRLHTKMQTDQGAVQAAQTIQDINIEQIKQLTALKDLLATQLAVTSTALQVNSSKDESRQEASTVRFKATDLSTASQYKNPTF